VRYLVANSDDLSSQSFQIHESKVLDSSFCEPEKEEEEDIQIKSG
jgi:hypothetical protein